MGEIWLHKAKFSWSNRLIEKIVTLEQLQALHKQNAVVNEKNAEFSTSLGILSCDF